MKAQASPDTMRYENTICEIVDILLAAHIKNSTIPQCMRPFFALVLVESQIKRTVRKVEKNNNFNAKDFGEGFREKFFGKDCWYNEQIVRDERTLANICAHETTFERDFSQYLQAFDSGVQKLLGVNPPKNESKFLNIKGIVAKLKRKHILLPFVKKWASIDLSQYDNPAVVSLIEYIKEKWIENSSAADEEQNIPLDIISLIAEIASDKVSKSPDDCLRIYDPTCKGTTLLSTVSNHLKETKGFEQIAIYGIENDDALYAFSSIESGFLNNTHIESGNVLTHNPFAGQTFDVIIASLPYENSNDNCEKDLTENIEYNLPSLNINSPEKTQEMSIEDSILNSQNLLSMDDGSNDERLLMQHIQQQLSIDGIAIEIHNEEICHSDKRFMVCNNNPKALFDQDWVEAIIRLPQGLFPNIDQYTYLWIINKNKPASRRNFVALIDASNELLEQRTKIINALHNFKTSEICKIFYREHFYSNDVSFSYIVSDDEGHYVQDEIEISELQKIINDDKEYAELHGLTLDAANDIILSLGCLLYRTVTIVAKNGASYTYQYYENSDDYLEDEYEDDETSGIIEKKSSDGTTELLGRGMLSFEVTEFSDGYGINAVIKPLISSVNVNVPYHFDKEENDAEVSLALMGNYIQPTLDRANAVIHVNFAAEFLDQTMSDSSDTTQIVNRIMNLIK